MRKLLSTSSRRLSSYSLLGEISHGSYGVVCKATHPSTVGRFYAVKKVKTVDDGETVSCTTLSTLREIKVLKELRHRNVVTLVDVVLDGTAQLPSLALVFEYAELELGHLIRHHYRGRSRIPPTTVKSIMKQLLDALRYLHSNWIVHRDVKPQNVLIMGGIGAERGTVKLADFGLALVSRGAVVKPLPAEGPVVTLWYRAPELLLGARSYTNGVDLWALGCVFGEMMICEPLFRGDKEDAVADDASGGFERGQCHEIFKCLGHPTPSTWEGVRKLRHWSQVQQWQQSSERQRSLQQLVRGATDGAFGLLARLLALNPTNRVDAEHALRMDYFAHELPRAQTNALVHDYPIRELRPHGGVAAPPAAPPVAPPVAARDAEQPAQKRQRRVGSAEGGVSALQLAGAAAARAAAPASPPSNLRRTTGSLGFASPSKNALSPSIRYRRPEAPPRRRGGSGGVGGSNSSSSSSGGGGGRGGGGALLLAGSPPAIERSTT